MCAPGLAPAVDEKDVRAVVFVRRVQVGIGQELDVVPEHVHLRIWEDFGETGQ